MVSTHPNQPCEPNTTPSARYKGHRALCPYGDGRAAALAVRCGIGPNRVNRGGTLDVFDRPGGLIAVRRRAGTQARPYL